MLPVNLKVFDADASDAARSLSSDVKERNIDFRRFSERMQGMDRVFVIKGKSDSNPRLVSPPSDDEERADSGKEWLDCCLREYLDRKRIFTNRFESRKKLIFRICTILVPFLAALWFLWPLWRVLIDVETVAYYKALGVPATATAGEITKAYRAMIKRWHPDHNPECGQYCRDQTERVKEAYQMLLSRGDHRFTLANQYHEGLMALRSTLAFRGFQISGGAAMEVFMILSRLLPGSQKDSGQLRLGCGIAILLFCTVHETLYVSGFNLSTVIGLVYYGFSMAKASAQQRSTEEVTKNSYFDLLYDAAVLLGSAGLVSVACHLQEYSTVSMEEVFRMLYGSVYALSFLYKFSPNIYDNFLMRKYSLPLTYMDMSSYRFTWTRFALSELSFLVDDLFVFTCRVPSPYRVVVYVAHFICLCQLLMLPWDAPITNGRAGSKAAAARASTSNAPPVATAMPTVPSSDGHADITAHVNTAVHVSPLTKEEEEVVTDLDSEPVAWLDVVNVKYKTLILSLSRRYTQQQGKNAETLDIAANADTVHVNVFALNRGKSGGAASTYPKLELLCQVRDPEMNRLLALDRGPKMLIPPRPNTPWTAEMAYAAYTKALGGEASLTNSQLWQRRTPAALSRDWMLIAALALSTCVAALLARCLLCPSAHDVVRGSKGLDNSLRPQLFARFSDALPNTHFLNVLSGGLLTVTGVPIAVVEWWDAGVTLGFIR